MRIAIGQLMEESNTFALQRADLRHFQNNQLLYGDDIVRKLAGTRAEVAGFLDALARAGAEVVPTVAANCVSAGEVPRETFQALTDALLTRLAGAGRLDGVLLALHGSMVVEGDPDGEGALLAAVRAQVGPSIPIVATLDLHAHITPRMVAEADAFVGYDTYPHVDLYETGVKGARLLLGAVRGEIRPATVLAKSPMIVPAEGMGTGDQPMAGLMAEAKRLEKRPGVLSVSLFPVQPWLDIPKTGFSVVAVIDGARRATDIEPVVRELAWKAWEARHAFEAHLLPVDDAIRRALATEGGPIVLSESADGTGAGSPGDSVAVLARLLALGVRERCLVTVVDPPAVARAIEAGVGQEVTVSVGGALDPRYSAPVTITGRVRHLSDGRFIGSDLKSRGTEGHMGRAAVIEVGGISVLATERPAFTVDPAFYRSVGLEPRDAKIVVVKSALQFRDGYGPFAKAMWVVDTPGPSTANLTRLPWKHLTRPLFPFDDDFEPEIRSTAGRARSAPPRALGHALMTPVFRWAGAYWGFLVENRLYDRYGRHAGWLESPAKTTPVRRERRLDSPGPDTSRPDDPSLHAPGTPDWMDVYDRAGRFLGELRDGCYVLRSILRSEPIPRAPCPAVPYPTPPAPPPDREARDPRDDWSDALPWPLPPPEPPTV